MFYHLKQLGLDSVAMLKRNSKVYYRYRGRNYSVKALYQRLLKSKRSHKQDYLYSSIADANFQKGTSSRSNLFLWQRKVLRISI